VPERQGRRESILRPSEYYPALPLNSPALANFILI
jgi:hypothetical protein